MKKIVAIITAAVLLVVGAGCSTNDTASTPDTSDVQETSSNVEASSNGETSSQATSSDDTVSHEGEEEMNTANFYNIDEARKQYPEKTDSELFVEAEGYVIDGYYTVDADTLRMLTTVPCVGNGRIYYKDYNNFTEYIRNRDYGIGHGPHHYGEQILFAPVDKLSDPLFMSMVLPSEGITYQNILYPDDPRANGNNMHKPCTVENCTQCNKANYVRLNALGAVYLNQAKKAELEQYKDVEFRLCIANITLLVNYEGKGWQKVKFNAVPEQGFGDLYCLPWQLEWNPATSKTYLENCRSVVAIDKGTHTEIPLKLEHFFFTKTFTGTDGKSYTIDERVFHFWGDQWGFRDDDKILAVIASYDMWVEYDESCPIKVEDYLISSIGADWRYQQGRGFSTNQAFAGYKHAVSTEKVTVFGHNIGPSDYDTLVTEKDLEQIKEWLNIK